MASAALLLALHPSSALGQPWPFDFRQLALADLEKYAWPMSMRAARPNDRLPTEPLR
jgi:hypothetical protein